MSAITFCGLSGKAANATASPPQLLVRQTVAYARLSKQEARAGGIGLELVPQVAI
jgi:hypothetical protein